jgi:MoxR-like ATPase
MITCQECQHNDIESDEYHVLTDHLQEEHHIGVREYKDRYGSDAPIASEATFEEFKEQAPKRRGSEEFKDIQMVGEFELEAEDRDPVQGFERPPSYRYPQKGEAKQSVERLARAISYGRHTYIYGHNGTGKSASVKAIGADLNMECSMYPMREGLDPKTYLGQMEVVIDEETGQNKTEFKEGRLLQDLKGRVDEQGDRHGVLICVDDIDRAPAEYHEVFRHVMDSNGGRVFVPELQQEIDVHPDTTIVATANSAGRGDNTGFYSSVQVMDESILDRFERVIEYHFLEPDEERAILAEKFPDIEEEHASILDDIINVTEEIRKAIESEELYITFSHRRLEQWAMSCRELLDTYGFYKGVVHEAARDWMEWYDQMQRDRIINRFVDLHTETAPSSHNKELDMLSGNQ